MQLTLSAAHKRGMTLGELRRAIEVAENGNLHLDDTDVKVGVTWAGRIKTIEFSDEGSDATGE